MIEQQRQAQKMEAIGRLAGGVAHDFNNLLTVIRGFGEMLLHDGVSESARPKLEQIVAAADRAAALTRQLLAFSRQQDLQLQIVDPNDVVRKMQSMLQRLIGEDIECSLKLAPDLMPLKVDPTQLEQVVMNLAANARDAMPNGGRLAIETCNVTLDETYCRQHPAATPGDYVRIAVSDTGLGMDKATLARVFEPFFTTKMQGEGTGLGLATVYGIVQQSGGFIWAYSEPGNGSVFKIYFPAVAALPERKAQVISEPAPLGSETVLVVEDETGLCNLTREFLSGRGYTVLHASHPTEALQVAQSHAGPIHLLLTDVIMPGSSGPELATLLRTKRPNLRVLYMSGYTDRAILKSDELSAHAAFLQKPFLLHTLAVKVREVLGRSADLAPIALCRPQPCATALAQA